MPDTFYHINFFPFCYSETPQSSPLFRPQLFPYRWTSVTTSIYNAMGLYWRVREFEVSGQLYNPIEAVFGGNYLIPFTLKFRSTAETEQELVCYKGFEPVPPFPDFDDTRFDLFPSGYSPTTMGIVPVYGNTYGPDRKESYSALCVFLYSNIFISQSNEESSSFSTDKKKTNSAITHGVISAFGTSTTIQMWSDPGPEIANPPEDMVNILNPIIATEYWSYDNYYDTSTGLPAD